MKRQFSAGGVVYKKENNQTFWLLIQPKGTNHWQFPKGLIEEGESSKNAAVREIREETGVSGQIVEKIGSSSWWFVQDGERIFKTTTYFLMEAEEDTGQVDPVEVERAVWLLANEVEKELSFNSSKKIFAQARTILSSRLF